MSINNLDVYKLAKGIAKDGPKALEALDKAYTTLSKYSVFFHVRKAMRVILESKDEMKHTIDVANKTVQNKGRIK